LEKCATLENIPQVPANQAKAGQNHDARKAVSAAKYLEKCGNLGKMRHTCKNMPHLENWVTLGK